MRPERKAERVAAIARSLADPQAIKRFEAMFDARDGDACWPARGRTAGEGYVQIRIDWSRNISIQAHRFAYQLYVGPIPAGLVLDHACHNRDLTCPGGGVLPAPPLRQPRAPRTGNAARKPPPQFSDERPQDSLRPGAPVQRREHVCPEERQAGMPCVSVRVRPAPVREGMSRAVRAAAAAARQPDLPAWPSIHRREHVSTEGRQAQVSRVRFGERPVSARSSEGSKTLKRRRGSVFWKSEFDDGPRRSDCTASRGPSTKD